MACPRKCCGHFRANCTQLKYSRELQTDGVIVAELISMSEVLTSEQGLISQNKGNRDLADFQMVCPRKWCGRFRANSTQLKYTHELHTDTGTAAERISMSKCSTSEQGTYCSEHDYGIWDPVQRSNFLT